MAQSKMRKNNKMFEETEQFWLRDATLLLGFSTRQYFF